MEALILNGTDDTPGIVLDKANNTYCLSGRSLPEDVTVFYKPVFDWLDAYAQEPAPKMDFEIKLEYFNTASSKILLDILMKLEQMHSNGAQVLVKWFHDSSDEDMLEAGEEFKELIEVPFEVHTM